MKEDRVFIYCEQQFQNWDFEQYMSVLKTIAGIPGFLVDHLFVEGGRKHSFPVKGMIDSEAARMAFEEASKLEAGVLVNDEIGQSEGGFIDLEYPKWSFRSKGLKGSEGLSLRPRLSLELTLPLKGISLSYSIIEWGSEQIRRTHFRYQTIVPHSGILSWLHYFSPAAIGQYRLERLFENPYLRVTGVGEGHLFEVLEDPFEIHTPEGEAKVIAANRRMLDHPN